jgi:hypothetical protein
MGYSTTVDVFAPEGYAGIGKSGDKQIQGVIARRKGSKYYNHDKGE